MGGIFKKNHPWWYPPPPCPTTMGNPDWKRTGGLGYRDKSLKNIYIYVQKIFETNLNVPWIDNFKFKDIYKMLVSTVTYKAYRNYKVCQSSK